MKPKFTDLHKYPRGYKPSCATDITKSWEAARKKMEVEKQKRDDLRKKIEQLPSIHKTRKA